MSINTFQNYSGNKEGKTPSLTSRLSIWLSYLTRTIQSGYDLWVLSMFVKGEGLVRSVRVKTKSIQLVRPVSKIVSSEV